MQTQLSQETQFLRADQVERKWLVVDAANQPLGRLCTQIATVLRGATRPVVTTRTGYAPRRNWVTVTGMRTSCSAVFGSVRVATNARDNTRAPTIIATTRKSWRLAGFHNFFISLYS